MDNLSLLLNLSPDKLPCFLSRKVTSFEPSYTDDVDNSVRYNYLFFYL